ncbi:polymorphic toxin-type HINT domain-containing protein [Paractinoplanes ovalisporus]|uniref:polymorphic toxin-type HINT domain-containing protein n=1 Tax=Paractinoplanes ovalisporus TaxID=2810368 RepID=UPI00193B44BF|nr:polymorphic toxin-type HINT domain-containing protein [Actinoplanes ovalisporus]
MGARNYDPDTGRFDSTDPQAQPNTDPSVSTYSYTNARPTVLTDPTGEDPDNGGVFYGSATAAEYRMNNPDAAAATTDANVPDGGTVEVDNPEFLNAKKLVDEAEGFVKQIGDEIVNLILDLVGFNDAKACITEGDIVACISTALQAVPWGKMFKAAKVAIKAVGVGRRLIDAYSNLKTARKALSAIPQRIKKVIDKPVTAVKSGAARQVENTVKAAKDIGGKAKATAKKATTRARNAVKSATEESCKVVKGASKRLSNSFVAGTLVLMADGTSRPIEKVQPGDTVQATDAETGVTEPRQVTATIVGTGDKNLVSVGFKNGEGVTATAGHKFYRPGQGWVSAADLKAGDQLRGTTVTATRSWDARTTVYNLTVDGAHTYYVVSGTSKALVHNCMSTQAITERLQDHVNAVVEDFEMGRIGLSRAQQAAVWKRAEEKSRETGASMYEMFRGDVIDELVKNRVKQDPKLNKILKICRRYEACPDFHEPGRNVWWDITTEGDWGQHGKDYTKPFGRGIHLPTR